MAFFKNTSQKERFDEFDESELLSNLDFVRERRVKGFNKNRRCIVSASVVILIIVLYIFSQAWSGVSLHIYAQNEGERGVPIDVGADRSLGTQLPSHFLEHTYQDAVDINSTLGFQKVFVVNIPSRPDKKGLMSLTADISKIDLEFVKGFTPDDLSSSLTKLSEGQLTGLGAAGCFWSHVKFLQQVIDENLTSALVIEDDIDWSIDIKKQLNFLQVPFTTLLDEMEPLSTQRKIYKDDPFNSQDWDILWLGSCDELSWKSNRPEIWQNASYSPHVSYKDDTQEEAQYEWSFMSRLMSDYGLYTNKTKNASSQGIRVVQRSRSIMCTGSYAVSRNGARKVLRALLTTTPWRPVDLVLKKAIIQNQLRSYSVMPPLFAQWRHADGSKDSDIKEAIGMKSDHKMDIQGGHSLHISNSIRKTLKSAFNSTHTSFP